MCGIAGYLGELDVEARGPLASLAHRGPDDSGWVAQRSSLFPSLLMHRRLSILDLSAAGHQPMATADGTHTIVFNGEVYNYRELRDELQKLGVVFRTQTDTEVLLQAYAQWGSTCLTRLIGMFAFALRDERRRVLFLARDCFGIKPLYYVPTAKSFAFASEIKALIDWLPIPRTADAQRLYEYLRYGRTDHGLATMWSVIKQVPAAHYLEVPLDRMGAVEPVRYWRLPDEKPLDISFSEATDQVREIFLQNIRLHLRSDVPVGAALSGGIDSSAIACAMRAVEPSADVHAFSYIADDPAMSEEHWVDLVGRAAGATVHKIRAEPDDLIADLDRLIYTQDEPFGSTSIYAQYRVFKLAQERGIKVMLDGQGADELLAGYRSYVPARLSSLVRQGRFVDAVRFAQNASQLPGMRGRLRLWLQAARLLLPDVGSRWFHRWRMPTWLNAGWFHERGVALHSLDGNRSRDMLREELRQTVATSSLPMLLRYEDRNSMASSIESRVPFLTPGLADFVLRLPEEHILGQDGTTKNVFRQAMRGIVPDAVLDRRDKIGFATPEQRWLKTLRPWVEQTLASDRARSIAALDLPAVTRNWQAVLAGTAEFDFRVWRWVNLIRWAERFDVTFG
jgi:asparagine synthase (glutamine-hydrolysing)